MRRREKKAYLVKVTDPEKPFSQSHSVGYYTFHDAMVLYWAHAITPNAPMAVCIYTPSGAMNNRELVGRRLTLDDVPSEYHDEFARWIAEDILECLEFAGEEDRQYRDNRKL